MGENSSLPPNNSQANDDDHDDDHEHKENHTNLDLSLSTGGDSNSPMQQSSRPSIQPHSPTSPVRNSTATPNPPRNPPTQDNSVTVPSPSLQIRSTQRLMNLQPQQGKSDSITPLYRWAMTSRARIHSLHYLLTNRICMIGGRVQCKRCEREFEIEFDLRQKFIEVATYISKNKLAMHDRAPAVWMNPTLSNCRFCDQKNCVKPIASKKRFINWLFLFLGQMLGCCKLSELKYFCKHTKIHRTGAKDRVLYSTYIELCKQLDPYGNF